MARLGVSKKKKTPRTTELSQPQEEVQRLTEQLGSRDREQTATREILRVIASSLPDIQPVLDTVAEASFSEPRSWASSISVRKEK